MRVSITLRLRESEVTSSSAWRTGMRWVRSPVAMARGGVLDPRQRAEGAAHGEPGQHDGPDRARACR